MIEIKSLPPLPPPGPDELSLNEVIDGFILANRRGDPDEVAHWQALKDLKENRGIVTKAMAHYEPPHPVYHEIKDILNFPYELQKYLEKFGLKLKDSDVIGPEAVREACLEFIKSDKFRECYARIDRDRREEEQRQNLKKRRINITGRQLRDLTDASQNAIVAANEPPIIFIRAGMLVKVCFDEKGNPIIRFLKENGVRHIMERCAEYHKLRPKTLKDQEGSSKIMYEEVPVPPPMDVVRDFMELPDFPFPPLVGIIECPTILEDNSLLVTPGYSKRTGLYFATDGMLRIQVPDHPTQGQVEEAVELIKEIFCDFPFDSAASRTNVIAGLFTVVLRPMIKGNCQMMVVDKPCAGTGASLITDVISLIATGHKAAMMTAKESEEEWRKAITSILLTGQTVINIDNIEGKLYSAALAAVITSEFHQDRLLGCSQMVTIPNRAVWIGNGNNVQLGGDLPRRCYLVRMDAQEARPWQRTGFTHPDLGEWVLKERGRILSAILTITRGWILSGRRPPSSLPPCGGFENWRDTIGGILEYCQIPEFLGNLEVMYAESDCDTPQWEAFFSKWYEVWKDNGVTLAQVQQYLKMDDASYGDGRTRLIDLLPDVLADAWSGKKSFNRVLGKQLAKKNGRIMPNGLIIKKKGIEHQAVNWCVSVKPDKTVNMNVGSLGSLGSLRQPLEHRNKLSFYGTSTGTKLPNSPNSPKSDQEVL